MMNEHTLNSKVVYDKKYDAYIERIKELMLRKKELDRIYMDHVRAESNVHLINKTMIRLGSVVNAPLLSEAEAKSETGTILQRYSTPLRVKQTIDQLFTPRLNEHINDHNNPHELTPGQVGSMTSQQIVSDGKLYYNKGEIVDSTMRLGGSTFEQIRDEARSNLNVAEIKEGLLKYSNISSASRPARSIIRMAASGRLTWGPFDAGQSDATVYRYATGPSYSILGITVATVASWMNSNHPATNLIEGSLGVVKVRTSGSITGGYGNGGLNNIWNWQNVVILQVRNKRWVG